MKVLLINGSPRGQSNTYAALTEVAGALEAEGIATEFVHLGNKPVRGCIACRACAQTHRCVFDDDLANEVIQKLEQCDGVVVGTPVYFAAPNGSLCALLDRVFYADAANFAGKVAAAVAVCRRAGSIPALERLNRYFNYAQMPVASSQYWNVAHGAEAGEVRQDAEGLQIMRTLGRNMAWMLNNLQQGGVPRPQPEEERQRTNFIR